MDELLALAAGSSYAHSDRVGDLIKISCWRPLTEVEEAELQEEQERERFEKKLKRANAKERERFEKKLKAKKEKAEQAKKEKQAKKKEKAERAKNEKAEQAANTKKEMAGQEGEAGQEEDDVERDFWNEWDCDSDGNLYDKL